MKNKNYLALLVMFTILFSNVQYASSHKISVKFVDHWLIRYIKGLVTDNHNNGIKNANLAISGCNDRSFDETNDKGEYIIYLSSCEDYNVSMSICHFEILNVNINEDNKELLEFNIEIPSRYLLIATLSLLANQIDNACVSDWNNNQKVDIGDAIYILKTMPKIHQCMPFDHFDQKAQRSSSQIYVELWSDTNGDGIQEKLNDYQTDNYGNLIIENLNNGTYSLIAQNSQNNKAAHVKNVVIAGQDVNLKAILLKPVGSISGTVVLEGESDYSDAIVYIPGSSFDAKTDINGLFQLSYVPEGTYDIKIKKDTFGTIYLTNVPVYSGQDSDIGVISLPSIIGLLSGNIQLSDQTTHAGIILTLRNLEGNSDVTTSNAQGDFYFKNIPVGNYSLMASMSGYNAVKQNIFISVGTNTISLPQLFPVSTYGTLKGIVKLKNARNHSGAMIQLAGTQYMAVSNQKGEYTITHIPEGAYTAFISADGYKGSQSIPLTISHQKITLMNDELDEQFLTESCKTCGSIVGRGLYADKNSHVGINIKIEDTDIPLAGTDSNGSFIINDVPAGTYSVLFSESNYTSVKRTGIVVSAWLTTIMDDVLLTPPTGSIRGIVRVEDTEPADNVYQDVSVYGIYPDGRTTDTKHPVQQSEGVFILENVDAKSITIIATKPGYQYLENIVTHVIAGRLSIIETPVALNKAPVPPTDIQIIQASATAITLTWMPSISHDVAGYNIYKGTRSDLINQKCNDALTVHPYYQLSNLETGITYYFVVEAVDKTGLSSQRIPVDGSCKWTIRPKHVDSVDNSGQGLTGRLIDMVLNADGSEGYVANEDCQCIVSLKLNQDSPNVDQSAKMDIPSNNPPGHITFNPKNNKLYIIDTEDDDIYVANTASKEFEKIKIENQQLTNIIISPDGEYVIVSSKNPDQVTILYTYTHTIAGTISFDEDADPFGMAVANRKLYVVGRYSNKVYVVDLQNIQKELTIDKKISVGDTPYDIIARTDSKYLYVSHPTANGKISIIDQEQDAVIDTLIISDSNNVSKIPMGMSISGNTLYIVNFGDSTLSLVNVETNELLELNTPLESGGKGPVDIVSVPDGNRIFVLHQTVGSVEVFGY
jgi:DNA-binding beta-propeller fold protein YncE